MKLFGWRVLECVMKQRSRNFSGFLEDGIERSSEVMKLKPDKCSVKSSENIEHMAHGHNLGRGPPHVPAAARCRGIPMELEMVWMQSAGCQKVG